jgi:PAS domain S-box-containing protein
LGLLDNEAANQSSSADLTDTIAGYVALVNREGFIEFAGQCEGGLTPDKLVGNKVFDRVPPEARQYLIDKLGSVFETNVIEFIHLPAPARCSNGGGIEIRLVPMVESGKPLQTVAVAFRRTLVKTRDDNRLADSDKLLSSVTLEDLPCERSLKERHLIEAMLRQSEERFRQMAEASPQGILILQHDRIVFANSAAGDLVNCTSRELLGSSVQSVTEQFVDSNSLELVRARLKDRSQGMPTNTSNEIKIRTTAGRNRWIEVTAMPVTYEGDQAIQAALIDITARKETEEALSNSEERYRTLVENARNAIFSMEHDGTITFMNSVAGGMLGGESKDFIGKNVNELFPPDKAARHLVAVQRVIESGKGETIENLTELQGQPRWHITSIHPLNGHNGQARSAFMISTDITDSKLAAQKLARERDFTTMILQTANSLIFCLDKDARILLFNEECERVTGYRSEEVIGRRWPDIFMPERYRHYGLEDFGAWVHQNPADRREEPILTKSGEERIILWSNSSFIHPDSGEITAIAVGYDVTLNKLAEERLRQSEGRFKDLADLLPQMIFECDAVGKFTFINKSGLELFGRTSEELERGATIFDGIHPKDHERVRENIGVIAKGGSTQGNEYTAVRSDGTEFPVVAYTSRILREGELVGYRGILVDVTERRRAEELLHRSQEAYRDLVENVDDVLYTLDQDLVITYVSPVVKKVLGYDPSDLVGRSALSLVYSEDVPTIQEAVQDVLNGRVYPSEYRMVAKAGEVRWVRSLSRPIFERDTLVGVRGVLADIHERKMTEQALRESQQRFERVAQQSREMVWEINTDGMFTYVSQASDEILGYCPDEMIGTMYFYDLQPEEEREKFKLASLEQIARRESFHNQINKAMTKTGQVVWFLTSGAPVVDELGNLKGYVGADLDITERRQAEEALREKDEFLSSIIENIPDMIFVKDAEELRFVRFNKAGEELLGYKGEDLIGKNDYDIFPREQADFFTKKDREVFENGQLHEIPEEPIDTKHGRRILQTKKIPIVEKNGKPMFLLGISRDITDDKRAQEALRDSEERFRALYRGNPLPTYTWQWKGSDFVLVDCNDAASRGFEGYARNYLGLTAEKIYRNNPDCIQDIQSCYENQAIINREIKFIAHLSTGTSFDVAIRYNFVPPNFVLVVAEDITQRKRDEEALRMSEERFRVLIENQGEGVGIVDLNEVFQFANPAAHQILGVKAGELVGRNLRKFVSPEAWQTILDQTRKRQEGCSTTYELNIVRPDATRRRLLLAATPQLDIDGVVSGTFGIFRDITDTKRMEEALRSTNELLEQERHALLDKNIALKEILGQSKDEADQVKRNVQSNIDKLILPILLKLKEKSREGDRIDLDLLESLMSDVASPFLRDLESRFVQLTPRETEICNMIRNGLQSKEIGLALGISARTVEKFRQKIRDKLCVTGRDTNLTTFLRSITQKR